MSNQAATVTIVDDDDSVRRALARLLTATGYSVRTFASAPDLLREPTTVPSGPGCFLVDVRMPEVSGFELHAILVQNGADTPVVFMTGNLDDRAATSLGGFGAAEFLLKPFTDEALLDAVRRAIIRDGDVREHRLVGRPLS